MSVAEEIAREVNRRFFKEGSSNRSRLSGLFDEAIARRFIPEEEKPRIRSEATRIAVKLRLEVLKESRGA